MDNETYGFHKIEGFHFLPKTEVFSEEELQEGDSVDIFCSANGIWFLFKNENGIRINRITSAHIYFDMEITVERK